MVTPSVPELPAGTRLSLRAGEWVTDLGQLGSTPLGLNVVRLDGELRGMADWVWLLAHMSECRWPSSDCAREWCVKVAVRVPSLHGEQVAAAGVLRWEDPPPPARRGSDHLDRARARTVATQLRERPGQWAVIAAGVPNRSLITRIRSEGGPTWRPPGAWEAVCRVIDGRMTIYARYVGER